MFANVHLNRCTEFRVSEQLLPRDCLLHIIDIILTSDSHIFSVFSGSENSVLYLKFRN